MRYGVTLMALGIAAQAWGQPTIIGGPERYPPTQFYYYLLSTDTWPASQAAAVALGGNLTTVRSAAHNAWITATFGAGGSRNLWIGLSDAAVEGTFVWVNGEPVTYTNWGPGEPNQTGGLGNEDYAHIVGPPHLKLTTGEWNDVNLLEPNRFAVVEVTVCYANCDASAVPPSINIADYLCFLSRYSAGDPYANCDGSTTPPILTVNDFTCFLSTFSTGCP